MRLASIFLFTADHERSRELDGSFVTSHGFIESRDILNSNRHLLEGKGHQKDHRDTWTTLLACRGSLYLLVGRMRICLYVYVLLFIAHLHTSTVLKVLPKCFGKAVSGWLGGRALTEPKLPRPELTLQHFWLRHSVPLNYIYFLSTLLSASKEGRLHLSLFHSIYLLLSITQTSVVAKIKKFLLQLTHLGVFLWSAYPIPTGPFSLPLWLALTIAPQPP